MNLELITRQPDRPSFPIPILFVHGAWHGAWCWNEFFMPYFAWRGYTPFAFSYRGHGASDGRRTLLANLARAYVEDLGWAVAEVERQTGRRPVIVAHSLGGYVTQKYLESHQVPAAALLASIPASGALGYFLRFMRRHPGPFLKTVVTLNGYHLIGTPALTSEGFFSADLPEEQLDRYFEQMIPESFLAGLEASFNLPHPGKVSTPILVLGAANDQVFTVEEQTRTAQAYHAPVEIFPDMAHDMILEKSWQLAADRIMGWLGELDLK